MAVKRGLNKAKGLGSLIPQAAGTKQTPAAEAEDRGKAEEPVKKAESETEKKTAAKRKTTKAVPVKKEAELMPDGASEKEENQGFTVELRISAVFPNKEQPRRNFDEEGLRELADSIEKFGVLQPILVQKKGSHYEIISGERRWRAAKYAGFKHIPAIIKDFSAQESMEIALIENIQREDLNVIEEALAYQRLIEEFRYTQEEVAQRVFKSRSAVTNALRLLNLTEEIRQMLVDNRLTMGHARALLGLNDKMLQKKAAEEILSKGLNVRQTEVLIKKINSPKEKTEKNPVDSQLLAVLKDLENRLTEKMGTKVSIKNQRKDRGKIEIEYYSREDLERIIEFIRK